MHCTKKWEGYIKAAAALHMKQNSSGSVYDAIYFPRRYVEKSYSPRDICREHNVTCEENSTFRRIYVDEF